MWNKLLHKARLLYGSRTFLWIILAVGVLLRLARYVSNRSLWYDEARNALNIVNTPLAGLLHPGREFTAPPGFLILEKLAIQAFGNAEHVLRFFPLLFGVVSLLVFYGVANRCLRPKAVPIALGLFAISGPLVEYSSAVKQYSIDVAVVLVVFLLAIYVQSRRLTLPRVALLGVFGAVAIWFSHPSIFVLGGVGITLSVLHLARRDWARMGGLAVAYLLWAISFVVFYFVVVQRSSNSDLLLDYWSGSFVPPLLSSSFVIWLVRRFFGIFEDPVGLYLSGIAALAFIVGCISMFSRNKTILSILLSPVLLTLLASVLHKYPFSGRLLLFVVPSLIVCIAEGAEQIREKTKDSLPAVGMAFVALLFFHPLMFAGYHLIDPHTSLTSDHRIRALPSEDIKPVMDYLREHRQSEDIVYLYYGSRFAVRYYSETFGFRENDYVVGEFSRDDWGGYVTQLNKLRGNRRVWILLSHVCDWEGVDEEKFILYYLDTIGSRLDSFSSPGAAVYLYGLGEKMSDAAQ